MADTENLDCPFCGGACDPEGWVGSGIGGTPVRGPECEQCGACTDTIEDWNRRTTPPSPSTAPEHSQFVNRENAAAFKAPFNAVDEREAFEAWAVTAGPWDGPLQWGRHSNGEYKHSGIEGDWKVWQARAALASRPAEVDDEGLPPLPYSDPELVKRYGPPTYTIEQYRQGQRDAVAADRARRAAAGGGQ